MSTVCEVENNETEVIISSREIKIENWRTDETEYRTKYGTKNETKYKRKYGTKVYVIMMRGIKRKIGGQMELIWVLGDLATPHPHFVSIKREQGNTF